MSQTKYPVVQNESKDFYFEGQRVIDETQLSLKEWIHLMQNCPDEYFLKNWRFPTREHLLEFLDVLPTIDEKVVRVILSKIIMGSGNLGFDEMGIDYRFDTFYKNCSDQERGGLPLEFDRRYFRTGVAWEGVTWILDLLPNYPKRALDVLSSYFIAHYQLMPDEKITGLSEAITIIRKRYIDNIDGEINIQNTLYNLESGQFENVCAKLYQDMGYHVEITQPTRDGGIDIICRKDEKGEKNKLLVQCKRCKNKKKIGIGDIRELLGIVSNEKATKGFFITTSDFSPDCYSFAENNDRIELINCVDFIRLMNQYNGKYWLDRIDFIIAEMEAYKVRH
ncbi:MAG: restriction endonuclease [Cyanobacteria bacterium P01_E01_bin.42]